MPETLLSSKEAAEMLGCSVSTISRKVTAGELTPAVKGFGVRGPMWFRPSDIRKLAAKLGVQLAVKAGSR